MTDEIDGDLLEAGLVLGVTLVALMLSCLLIAGCVFLTSFGILGAIVGLPLGFSGAIGILLCIVGFAIVIHDIMSFFERQDAERS